MSPAAAPAPILESFTLERLVGSGGFADVYLYRQHLPEREVAVKVLRDGVSDRTAASFTAEANVMARLSAHPSIVTVYQAAISPDDRPYLVMEYYPRPNLNIRSRAKPLPVEDALDIMIRIAGAVETAHRAGIIHRDIKPANILTSAYGKPGLTDFGISAAKTDLADQDAGLSIPWCAPEVIEGRSAGDERSDVYSLAATLYSLLAGRSPYERQGQRNSQMDLLARVGGGRPEPLDRSDVPVGLQRVIAMGLDPEPDHRPQSAAAFARLLQEVEVQLHYAVTPLDVLGDAEYHDDAPADDSEQATRVRGATVVRPHATSSLIDGVPENPAAPVAVPDVPAAAVPSAAPLDDTVLRGRAQQPAEASAAATEAAPPQRGWLRWAAVAAAAVVVAGIAVTTLNGGATPEPAAQPAQDQDALVTTVPAPSDLTITRPAPTTATATWTVAEAATGDRYQWERFGPGSAGERGTVAEATLSFTDVAEDDLLCLRVWLVRSNGQRSASPAENCEG